MKVTIEIPEAFVRHFNEDRFQSCLENIAACAAYNDEGTAPDYEIKTLIMLIKALEESSSQELDFVRDVRAKRLSGLLKKIADQFTSDYEGDNPPNMEITADDMRAIADLHTEKCRLEAKCKRLSKGCSDINDAYVKKGNSNMKLSKADAKTLVTLLFKADKDVTFDKDGYITARSGRNGDIMNFDIQHLDDKDFDEVCKYIDDL